MSPRLLALPAVMLLASCSSPAERQVRQYEMMERIGATDEELCRKGKLVADAYLEAEQELEYRQWSVTASLRCNAVMIDRLRLGG